MKKIKCVMCKHQQEVEWKTTSQSGDGRYEVHEQQIACEECGEGLFKYVKVN